MHETFSDAPLIKEDSRCRWRFCNWVQLYIKTVVKAPKSIMTCDPNPQARHMDKARKQLFVLLTCCCNATSTFNSFESNLTKFLCFDSIRTYSIFLLSNYFFYNRKYTYEYLILLRNTNLWICFEKLRDWKLNKLKFIYYDQII